MGELERIQQRLAEYDAQASRRAPPEPLRCDKVVKELEDYFEMSGIDHTDVVLAIVADYLRDLPAAARMYAHEIIDHTLENP
jgi:hypothetical protein